MLLIDFLHYFTNKFVAQAHEMRLDLMRFVYVCINRYLEIEYRVDIDIDLIQILMQKI